MSKRLIKWLKRLLLGLAVLILCGWLAFGALLRSWIAQPPPLPPNTSFFQLKPEPRDGKVWLGKSWTGQREGLPVVCLRGTPLEIGYAEGVLLQARMRTLESEFLQMVHQYVPQEWKMNLLKDYIIYRNRHLSDWVALPYRMEIMGLTLGCPDSHPQLGPYYNRLLNYHAAHDISYMLIDNPLIAAPGCTSFGAWGGATENGHLLTGRNFDWEAAEVFGRERVVLMFEPEGGIPFVSLAWAGMVGVVSGMNRAGVSVTVNGAPSALPKQTATPVAIVAREVLQNSHDLGEALNIVREAKVFVCTIWLIGSRSDGKFIVVEKTPGTTQVRQPDGDWISCANHFETAELKDEPRNQTYRLEATSVSRETRLQKLVASSRSHINAAQTAAVLRDRALADGRFAGNGHRGALNALIATHATIMDLTAGIFWAASPPNQLGKFVAFDLNDFSRDLPELAVPADSMLDSGESDRAGKAHLCLAEGEKALRHRDPKKAFEMAAQAEELNPGFYQNLSLRGRALLSLGRRQEAAQALQAALKARPAFLSEQRELEDLLKQANGP